MLFNSVIYLYIFLPVAVIGYFVIAHFIPQLKNYWLVGTSIFFYGFWNPIYVPLLLGSMVFNFFVGSLFRVKDLSFFGIQVSKKTLLIFGLVANLLLLGVFKYADFFIQNFNWVLHTEVPFVHFVLPLAISFFTFQQVAYLVDSYKEKVVENSFIKYSLFVTFFPQLIAGPIVHHREMLPQFAEHENSSVNYAHIAAGIFIILIGLVKKVWIADTFAVWANLGYSYAGVLTLYDAWVTSLAYTFQLYFDFSGYTDMAIGSALLFNVVLPKNFNSPYKALNIQDFWRRWHMTLSRFLRDYIYIPLGGNRPSEMKVHITLLIVFILGGLWHGPSWTFVAWGLLHGLASVIYRTWSMHSAFRLPTPLAWLVTFNFVNVTWVFFRADSFEQAKNILMSMAGLHGIGPATELFSKVDRFATPISPFISTILIREISIWIFVTLGLVLLFKNSDEWFEKFKPTVLFLFLSIALYVIGVIHLNGFSEFLYFNF